MIEYLRVRWINSNSKYDFAESYFLRLFVAEGARFELARLLTCRFSRPVPSTARSTFRRKLYHGESGLTNKHKCDRMEVIP